MSSWYGNVCFSVTPWYGNVGFSVTPWYGNVSFSVTICLNSIKSQNFEMFLFCYCDCIMFPVDGGLLDIFIIGVYSS
jgi:hypothetical protein